MKRFRRYFLHIGFEKTGSTSIQSFLTKNIKNLSRHGFFVPLSLARKDGFCNHMRLCACALDPAKTGDDTIIHYGLATAGAQERFREETIQRFATEAEQATAQHTLLLSNEHLSSRLSTIQELIGLKDLLEKFCERVTIIGYLRRQSEVLQSAYNEAIKAGFYDIDLMPDFSGAKGRQWVERDYFEYDTKLEQWAEVFGRDNLVVKLFDRTRLLFGDVVQDFLFTMHLDPSKFCDFPRANEGLDREAQTFLEHINKLLSGLPADRAARIRDTVSQVLMNKACGPGRRLTEREVQQFQMQFTNSNEQVRQRWFADRASLFVQADEKIDADAPLAPDATDAGAMVKMIGLILEDLVA